MSILIEGMNMPKGGPMIVAIRPDGMVEDVMGCYVGKAISVPPHGRLGDLDRLAKEVKDMAKEFPPDSIGAERYRLFMEFIKTAPTIIPAEEEK